MRETQSRSDTRRVPPTDRDSSATAAKATPVQLAEQTSIDDLKWLMGDVRGRRFVWRQLEGAGIYSPTFTGEALTSAFKEGERNQGLKLMSEILRHCPQRLSEMQKEAQRNERRNEGKAS